MASRCVRPTPVLATTATPNQQTERTDRQVCCLCALCLVYSTLAGDFAAFLLHTREDSENFLASALIRFSVGKFAYDSILWIARGLIQVQDS